MTAVMCWWRRFLRRHAVAKQQVKAATRQVEEARGEREHSRQLLEQTREKVAQLTTIDKRNGYSEMIRDALSVGYDPSPRKRGHHQL